jgi:nitrate reductase gamma subunit
MRDSIFTILFVWYPYVCLTIFLLGSLIRYDREQYSWKASSSQILRRKQLTWGSNLFHFGILFLLFGHTVGLLTPTSVYTLFMTVELKQLVAVIEVAWLAWPASLAFRFSSIAACLTFAFEPPAREWISRC